MTLIERDHLLAHMQDSDQRPRNSSSLGPNPQTQIDAAQNQAGHALAHEPAYAPRHRVPTCAQTA